MFSTLFHVTLLLPSLYAFQTSSSSSSSFSGRFFTGTGDGDATEWLQALDTARGQFSPNAVLQDVSMLYLPLWNGFVEGPTWGAWWTQNSYGTTLTALPWLEEPHRSFIKNANFMWFKNIGTGNRSCDDCGGVIAPDGCLCDDGSPNNCDYKQGDGNVPIHDWALEETLSAVIMQAEQLLVDRDVSSAQTIYLPLFNRTLELIESRRDASMDLLLSGDASNLLAPSFGGWLLPNGTRAHSFLAGLSISYVAALDRVIELELLVGGDQWERQVTIHQSRRSSSLAGLVHVLEPSAGNYFVKSLDPNGTYHGVLGQDRHGYIEAVSNHDAVALRVAERVKAGLDEKIMSSLLGDDVPKNPKTNGPGLRPFSFVVTNAGGLDDMEYDDSSWLWSFGTWVNGGEWATCEARMMLAYARTGRLDYSLDSWRALMGFASIYRMDSPLVEWGSAVYQPGDPINIVYDMFAVGAALIRGLWDPEYTATGLTITPHVPGNITSLNSTVPIRFGSFRFYLSTTGNATAPITCVTVQGLQWTNFTQTSITFPFANLPFGPNSENHTVVIYYGGSATTCPPVLTTAVYDDTYRNSGSITNNNDSDPTRFPPLHIKSRTAAVRALRAMIPSDSLLHLDATLLVGKVQDGDKVAVWPDNSANGGNDASQSNITLQPIFRMSGAATGLPAVDFDGFSTFLSNANMALPASSTIFAVFKDRGTTNACCTGVFFSIGGCNGLGTKAASIGTDETGSALMIDWSGSPDTGQDDIKGRQVVASVVYNASGAYSFADGCDESQESAVGAAGTGYMVGSRNNEDARFVNGTISEVIVFARALNSSEMDSVQAYLLTKWPAGQPTLKCGGSPPNCTLPASLEAAAARLTRFVEGMRAVGQFADSLYELSHALLTLESVATWNARCAGLNNGSISPLPSSASERAADASYVNTATNLAEGLATVLDGYSDSTDARQIIIYNLWKASA